MVKHCYELLHAGMLIDDTYMYMYMYVTILIIPLPTLPLI